MLEKIKEIVTDFYGQEMEVTPESNLISDLGLTSLDLVEMVVRIEDAFDVEIPDRAISAFKTVGDVMHFLEEL